jgi:hypothetical protein
MMRRRLGESGGRCCDGTRINDLELDLMQSSGSLQHGDFLGRWI